MSWSEVIERARQRSVDSEPTLTLPDVASRVLPDYRPRPTSDHLAERLTEAITRVEQGEQVRIVVTLPPGSGKSSISSVALPVWALHHHPSWEVAIVSAEQTLARKFSRDVRRAIRNRHAPGVTLSDDSAAVDEWTTEAGGSFIARGMNGAISGRRLRVLVVDDPIRSLADAYSPRLREAAWQTWTGELRPRMRESGSLVIVMHTRWHEDDLAGRILDKDKSGQWEEIRIPAIAEAGDPLGRRIGEPLISPQRDEDEDEARERWGAVRLEVGSYVWDALYQQRPSAPGGTVFLADWWRYYQPEELPEPDKIITSWDLTFGAEHGDYCVGQVWQRTDGSFYLLDQTRFRGGFVDQVQAIKRTAEKWPTAEAHVVEAAANGAAAIETLRKDVPGVVPTKPVGAKEVRAQAVAPLVEAGNVYLPEGAAWLPETLGELTAFPTGQHDDTVDALQIGLARLKRFAAGAPAVSSVSASTRLAGW